MAARHCASSVSEIRSGLESRDLRRVGLLVFFLVPAANRSPGLGIKPLLFDRGTIDHASAVDAVLHALKGLSNLAEPSRFRVGSPKHFLFLLLDGTPIGSVSGLNIAGVLSGGLSARDPIRQSLFLSLEPRFVVFDIQSALHVFDESRCFTGRGNGSTLYGWPAKTAGCNGIHEWFIFSTVHFKSPALIYN